MLHLNFDYCGNQRAIPILVFNGFTAKLKHYLHLGSLAIMLHLALLSERS